jgi:hypothetical protein
MILPWLTRETVMYLHVDESYAEILVDDQQWSYSIRPRSASLTLPAQGGEGVEILIKVNSVPTVEAARKLCELIAEAVGE